MSGRKVACSPNLRIAFLIAGAILAALVHVSAYADDPEIPTVLRAEFYAVAALAGAGAVVIGESLGLPSTVTTLRWEDRS